MVYDVNLFLSSLSLQSIASVRFIPFSRIGRIDQILLDHGYQHGF